MARSLGASALPVFRLRDLPMAPERGAQRDVCWRQYTETVQLHFRFAPPWRVVGGRARGRVRGCFTRMKLLKDRDGSRLKK
ncbi:unnamed protein product [Prorocentrum cordatum]|uniref:Uncharacterized protein n=1 Tax=Prorocentrum cordatum TaxID=2364126 RepID=A0ABN9VKK5_9DINO|nr:unnamed protein product [Polarella glacialis]